MKITKVIVGKEYKFGLPNYSNITARCDLEVEVGEDEDIKWDQLWDEVNKQLHFQADGIEPSWIKSKEYKNFFKITIPK